MPQGNGIQVADDRRLLAERIAASPYLNRSARLRDLLLYLTERALEHPDTEIHEQEVGHRVFGRPADYDTSSDNIVRVHASMLRKRLDQYFSAEGAGETTVIEVPKGNYAPVFRERATAVAPAPDCAPLPVASPAPSARAGGKIAGIALLVLVACAVAYFVLLPRPTAGSRPNVQLLWSQIFQPNRPTDLVLDDAAVSLYQELTGRTLALSDYFDRNYLRSLPDSEVADVALKRQSSFASVSFLWRLYQMPGFQPARTALRFARDYSFRDLKADNAILVGNSHSNPWMEPFASKLGITWQFEKSAGVYYPVDARSAGQTYLTGGSGDAHDTYFSAALLPNLGGKGNVLLVSGTGGTALQAGADFLADEAAVSNLRSRLPSGSDRFPYFEALIKVKGRSSAPGDASIVICRQPRS
jgi:hypothetical protein